MNSKALSNDTEVVLLLCGRFGGERQELFQPLSNREYGEFAKWLNSRGLRPADLMSPSAHEHLLNVHEAKLELKRIEFLLGRGTALALALERWSRGGLWVISRGDIEFPKRLKHHLKHVAPPLLYGAGNKELLNIGGLAIVGSRDAMGAVLDFTRKIAAKCAHEGIGVVSGGARGVDATAMQGATDAGGYTIGVLANDLLKASVSRQNRIGLTEGRLVLVSPFYPEAGFNAGNAMARNKYIYALSEYALVIDSALGSGGTWAGAMENLAHKWVPLYVRNPGNGLGNAALIEKGGIKFELSQSDSVKLVDFFDATSPEGNNVAESNSSHSLLPSMDMSMKDSRSERNASMNTEEPSPKERECLPIQKVEDQTPLSAVSYHESAPHSEDAHISRPISAFDMYDDFRSKLHHVLAVGPLTDQEVAERLGLELGQAKAWLKKAVGAKCVEKLYNPVRYQYLGSFQTNL
ncbi:DNA-processing protein DprA [Janthinobacterium lividum]